MGKSNKPIKSLRWGQKHIEGDFIRLNEWLTPLSWLYGMVVALRNQLFEIGILKSTKPYPWYLIPLNTYLKMINIKHNKDKS